MRAARPGPRMGAVGARYPVGGADVATGAAKRSSKTLGDDDDEAAATGGGALTLRSPSCERRSMLDAGAVGFGGAVVVDAAAPPTPADDDERNAATHAVALCLSCTCTEASAVMLSNKSIADEFTKTSASQRPVASLCAARSRTHTAR